METLVMIKPEATTIADKILQELDENFKREETFEIKATGKFVKEFYTHVFKQYSFLGQSMIKHFRGETLTCAIYSGENVRERMNKRVGATGPENAEHGTIRGDYRMDLLRLALEEERCVKNIIHCSDPKNFENELEIISGYKLNYR